jgi:hypothetical protein
MSTFNLSQGDQRLFEQLIEKSVTDTEFRARLLENPKAVIEEATGVHFPATVRFAEKPADVDIYVVLPEPINANVELSEAELEAVAGGVMSDWCVCTDTSTCECTLFTCIQNTGKDLSEAVA